MSKTMCTAFSVKYNRVEYYEKYVVVEQNRIRRRIHKGYYFEDDGRYIVISEFLIGGLQHKKKIRRYLLNKETKEWQPFQDTIIKRHCPEKVDTINNEIKELRR